jgi:hypothetical protein
MDPLYPIALGLLLKLPAYAADKETPEERHERMEMTAESLASASAWATCSRDWEQTDWCVPVWPKGERLELLVMAITQGFWESRFALHVHQDRCGPTECDAIRLRDGSIYHRARTPWQLQKTRWVLPFWESMRGAKAIPTAEAAYAAMLVLGGARGRCGSEPEAWISGYGWGRCDLWRGAPKRAAMYDALLRTARAGAEEAKQAVATL